MFGFLKNKRDYRKICQDPKAVYNLLYSDRSKTSEILDDGEFIDAWLNGDKQREITMIIRKEAINGDMPSLKQMVWFLGTLYQEISVAGIEKNEKLTALIGLLTERITYCKKLIALGDPQHYYAMVSSFNLFKAMYARNEPGNLDKVRDVLNETVEFANSVITMGINHPAFGGDAGIVKDAENVLRETEGMRNVLDAMAFGGAKL